MNEVIFNKEVMYTKDDLMDKVMFIIEDSFRGKKYPYAKQQLREYCEYYDIDFYDLYDNASDIVIAIRELRYEE